MDHDTADDLVLDLVEGTLSPSLDSDVRAHVAGCDTCRENVDRLVQARLLSTTAAHELTAERAGDPLRGTVDTQVLSAASRTASSRRSRQSQRTRRRWRRLAIAALVTAAAAAAWLVGAS